MNRDLGPWAMLLQLGWTIALSIVGSLLVGLWIDRTFHTTPVGVLVFSLLGVIIGTVAVYRQVVRAINFAADEERSRKARKAALKDEEQSSRDDPGTKEDE